MREYAQYEGKSQVPMYEWSNANDLTLVGYCLIKHWHAMLDLKCGVKCVLVLTDRVDVA